MPSLPKINTEGLASFVDDGKIHSLLAKPGNDKLRVREVIAKSLAKNRLELDEMAVLLNASDPELVAEIFEGAKALKRKIYGNRIVLFAPLYVGNDCINNCPYCAFRHSNPEVVRKTLSMAELEKEVRALESRGHKRLIMVYGEHPSYDPDFIYDTVKKVYATKEEGGKSEIRRVNINAAPLDVEGFRKVKSAGIGTYQVFQETYHRPTYEKVHSGHGPKTDFLWRLFAFDRAMEAGIDDVGIGALIGLYDHKFEAMGLLAHTIHLEEKFRCGPHTISFPRIQPALGTKHDTEHFASDDAFKKMVAVLRLAVPYTGMILTCRESVALRNELIEFGVSQIDAGSDIGVGSYDGDGGDGAASAKKSQFVLGDDRPLDQVIGELCEADFLPSFCTGCYRLGRTGEHFMEFAVPGFVKNFCTPNAILTLLEYLIDYASPEVRAKGLAAIERELAAIDDSNQTKALLRTRIEEIKSGKRDLYF